jgi:hypothetical protein
MMMHCAFRHSYKSFAIGKLNSFRHGYLLKKRWCCMTVAGDVHAEERSIRILPLRQNLMSALQYWVMHKKFHSVGTFCKEGILVRIPALCSVVRG